MNKIKILICTMFIILCSCETTKYNKQVVKTPNGGVIKVKTPVTQDTPATVTVTVVTNTVDGLDVLDYNISTSSGTQHNTEVSTQEVKSRYAMFKIYHIGAVGLFVLGLIMILIKKPPEVVTGVGLIVGGFALGAFGGFMPVIAKHALLILILAVVACIIYVIIHRIIDKKVNKPLEKPITNDK